MRKYAGYRIAILVLSILVAIESALLIFFGLSRPKKRPEAVPAVVMRGKIAIVIDDWGYSLNNLPLASRIRYPLTFSVLPNLAYSQKIAEGMHQRGYEIILHLPLEPQEKYRLEKNTILTSMKEAAILNILKKDLASVPGASGVSNHMGSKASADYRTMEIIFKELKKKGLYFLDSLVSSQSVCSDLAHKMHLGFIKRDVFLDNQENPEYIKRQVRQLKLRSNLYGYAVGIGHDRKQTLEVLKEVMPELEREGYKFVFVSELVK